MVAILPLAEGQQNQNPIKAFKEATDDDSINQRTLSYCIFCSISRRMPHQRPCNRLDQNSKSHHLTKLYKKVMVTLRYSTVYVEVKVVFGVINIARKAR